LVILCSICGEGFSCISDRRYCRSLPPITRIGDGEGEGEGEGGGVDGGGGSGGRYFLRLYVWLYKLLRPCHCLNGLFVAYLLSEVMCHGLIVRIRPQLTQWSPAGRDSVLPSGAVVGAFNDHNLDK
jgi:hypothetical protein